MELTMVRSGHALRERDMVVLCAGNGRLDCGNELVGGDASPELIDVRRTESNFAKIRDRADI